MSHSSASSLLSQQRSPRLTHLQEDDVPAIDACCVQVVRQRHALHLPVL